MTLIEYIRFGGEGSGCHGDNCGRPSGAKSAVAEINEKFPGGALVVGGKPVVTFEVAEREGRLRIKTIKSVEPKSGAGSLVLRRILKIADRAGVTVELTSSPYGDEKDRISHEKLQGWYEKHGFKLEKGHDPSLGYMVREPR